MDSLGAIGIAANVIQVADLARRLTKDLWTRLETVKTPPPGIRGLATDLELIGYTLDELVSVIMREDDTVATARSSETMQQLLTRAMDILQDIASDFSGDNKKTGNPFKRIPKSRVEEYMQQLESIKSSLMLDLQVRSFQHQTEQWRRDRETLQTVDAGKLDRLRLSQPAEDQVVNDYLQSVGNMHTRYFDKLAFEHQPSYCIRFNGQVLHDISAVPPIEALADGFLQDANPHGILLSEPTTTLDGNNIAVILCDATSVKANTIPFSRDTFVEIMEKLQLSPGLFQALFTGTPKFVYYKATEKTPRVSIVLRTPMSIAQNWSLALSWSPKYGDIRGIIHGMKSHEMSQLAMHIGDARVESGHPINIPIILCEMLVESDSNGVKLHASNLYKVEKRTNFHGYTPSNSPDSPNSLAKGQEKEFAEMTQSLNLIISRLAFHEMRILANAVFVEELGACMIHMGLDGNYSPTHGYWSGTQRLEERLLHLKTEQRALLLEIACNQKIAQSQLEIVYNLVAQRDNKDNLSMARIQTNIANTTKEDSFAMRTIAVMSIAFLPATFVSSFFSMDMFDWQAPRGATVISYRFWIYWAVTAPLTLLVFSIWFFWIRKHHEDAMAAPNARHQSRTLHTTFTDLVEYVRYSRWKPKKRASKDEEKQTAGDSQVAQSVIATKSTESVLKSRSPARVVRADTILQGPRR
ncbi:hypothetical protein CC86DRAFT_452461 [Ophiobolus disseminans]|uniref:Fungal N-terminal domain-containing protein n=1 Tax=Ophiobolus disseminans TaxID=1469910 RepID=A0A6A7ADL7_9PLEO|nr:hypothetical protein CC86DRAFT_452461 [Ophiobolus disseminans]